MSILTIKEFDMTKHLQNVAAAFAAVLIVATSMSQVLVVPPAQASTTVVSPALA